MNEIMPGSRVLAFDLCRYGTKFYYPSSESWYLYPDLVDLQFDHRPDEISRAHFTDYVQPL